VTAAERIAAAPLGTAAEMNGDELAAIGFAPANAFGGYVRGDVRVWLYDDGGVRLTRDGQPWRAEFNGTTPTIVVLTAIVAACEAVR